MVISIAPAIYHTLKTSLLKISQRKLSSFWKQKLCYHYCFMGNVICADTLISTILSAYIKSYTQFNITFYILLAKFRISVTNIIVKNLLKMCFSISQGVGKFFI